MKAVAFNEYGSADNLELIEVAEPSIGDHQVLVKSKATSINPIDWKLRQGYLKQMYDWQFPIIVGWDIAGVITEVGSAVTGWRVGDKVFARPDTTPNGTYAEFVAVDDHLLAPKPQNVSFAEAAAVPLAGLTAWQALFDYGKLQAGQKVLIQAGAGGVGTFAIQMAKNAGAEVWTTASQTNKKALQNLGADVVVDYHDNEAMSQITDMDLIIDTIGGQTQLAAFSYLKPRGKQISISPKDPQAAKIAKETHKDYQAIWLRTNGSQLAEIGEMMTAGKLKSVIAKELPFSKTSLIEAHQLSETGHVNGKIIINF
ncbi:NADP-dependent oxidoreductase [Lentilactobacillus kosonis]|uniref:Bifunctional protein: zinc-containing alcohol dehydrogenase, quinone oxidoreductase n=1 Tax=Lentilactobacillus kosonis TaxID=2810561 RepID=A0A401FNX6_9LACO|nr:NADP-dependent oxidoreductase [Lentilactobacillus kosonis]GAY74016.1 bifunctional protein: zinc-containing alcohol dehydrogenase, quinone oxidoreductase [Lentilactobacillus kosonis]